MLIMHPSMKRLLLTGIFPAHERGDLAELLQLALLHHAVVDHNQ
jgi:hypothetical protein